MEEELSRGVPYDVARRHPDAHKLTRVLGVRPGADVEPILHGWELGDIAILSTDGISDHVERKRLKARYATSRIFAGPRRTSSSAR